MPCVAFVFGLEGSGGVLDELSHRVWRACIGLEGSGMALASIPCVACVIGLDGSGMALASIPWGGLRELGLIGVLFLFFIISYFLNL